MSVKPNIIALKSKILSKIFELRRGGPNPGRLGCLKTMPLRKKFNDAHTADAKRLYSEPQPRVRING
jgi:hypothetical protein